MFPVELDSTVQFEDTQIFYTDIIDFHIEDPLVMIFFLNDFSDDFDHVCMDPIWICRYNEPGS